MRKSTTAEVGEQKILCMELSPRQVDALLGKKGEEQEASSLAVLMASDITTDAVLMSTGLTADQLLDEYTLEELSTVWKKVEEVNDFLLERLDKALIKGLAVLEKTAGKS